MSTHNIPFSIYIYIYIYIYIKENHPKLSQIYNYEIFKGTQERMFTHLLDMYTYCLGFNYSNCNGKKWQGIKY